MTSEQPNAPINNLVASTNAPLAAPQGMSTGAILHEIVLRMPDVRRAKWLQEARSRGRITGRMHSEQERRVQEHRIGALWREVLARFPAEDVRGA